MKKLILMLTCAGFLVAGTIEANASVNKDWSPYKSTKTKKNKRKKSGKAGTHRIAKRTWKASI